MRNEFQMMLKVSLGAQVVMSHHVTLYFAFSLTDGLWREGKVYCHICIGVIIAPQFFESSGPGIEFGPPSPNMLLQKCIGHHGFSGFSQMARQCGRKGYLELRDGDEYI